MEVGIEPAPIPPPATTTAAVITAPVPAATTALPTGSTTGSTTDSTTGSTTAGGQVQDMLDLALKQVGDEYVFGADVAESDPDTSVWDCGGADPVVRGTGRVRTSPAARSSSTWI